MSIRTLVTSCLPGVERATAEFGHAHGIELRGAVPLASVPVEEVSHLKGLTLVHGLKPKSAWERNLHSADGVLILCPPRVQSLNVEFLVQSCVEFGIPHHLTPGLRPAPILEWLDEGLEQVEDYSLMVSGPSFEEAPRLGGRAMRLLDTILSA